MKTCDTCNAEKTSIPYVVREATATRLERINTRLWVVVLILIFALIASNLAWIIYEKQVEVIESDTIIDCKQSGDGANIVGGCNVYYGTESQNQNPHENTAEAK